MDSYDNKIGYICNNIFRGLGNRIMVLIGDMRVANDYYKKDFYLYWHKLKCDFHDLFENDFKLLTKKDFIDNDKYIYFKLQNLNEVKGKVATFPILDNDDLDKEKNYLLMKYTDSPKPLVDIFLPYFQLLKPSKQILDEVNKYAQLFDEYTISIHVRRGNFQNYFKRSNNTDDKYFKIMDSHIRQNDKTKFFISSDEPSVEQTYVDRYKDKVIIYPHEYDEKEEDEKTSLICMLLLSKNKHMILSKYSTFSYLAWWFGNCQASVVIL